MNIGPLCQGHRFGANLPVKLLGYKSGFENLMDPEEIEFLGEKLLVSIVPSFTSDTIHLITGDFGPFRAGLPVHVPLWVAINLKQQKRCRIQPPEWMDVEKLENIKTDEKLSRNFTKMPSDFYMVEAKHLLGCASEDIPRSNEIRTIVKDIWDIRMSKIRSSVDMLVRSNGAYAAVDNLTIMEINSIRPLLPHALDQIYRMKAGQSHLGSQSQSMSFISHSRTSTTFQ